MKATGQLSEEKTKEMIEKKQRQNRKKKEARKKKKANMNKHEESQESQRREDTDRRSESRASSLKRAGEHSRIDEIRCSIAARLIQRTWQKYNCLRNEMRSIIEDIAIVDYTFRNEKLFDFTQIEIDESITSRH